MAETAWNLDPPPGFRGLNPDEPITLYVRHLPHWRQDGATYFVTFRLKDSLPQSRLRQLRALKREWEEKNPPPRSHQALEEISPETMRRVERWLDQGMGSCALKPPDASREAAGALHHFAGDRYELGCFVVMPNHVHAIVRPLAPDTWPLEHILHSWKRHVSHAIGGGPDRRGLWQKESFDRIIRDPEHLWRVIQYTARNPVKAGLSADACRLWINPLWEQLGCDSKQAPRRTSFRTRPSHDLLGTKTDDLEIARRNQAVALFS